jgi:hypothetical protein
LHTETTKEGEVKVVWDEGEQPGQKTKGKAKPETNSPKVQLRSLPPPPPDFKPSKQRKELDWKALGGWVFAAFSWSFFITFVLRVVIK